MKRTTVTLVAGLALVTIALAVTLSGSPVIVARANSIGEQKVIAETNSDVGACQAGEVLPIGTSAIRLALEAVIGPRVTVEALSGTRVLTSGSAGAGWTGGSVTVPVRPTSRTIPNVRVCFGLGSTNEYVSVIGQPTAPAVAATGREGNVLQGRIRIEYLRPDPKSWWSTAPAVARRMGLGHASAGTWIVLPLILVMGAIVAGASWLTIRNLR
jgi:hypothetical protein